MYLYPLNAAMARSESAEFKLLIVIFLAVVSLILERLLENASLKNLSAQL